ncbi:MAG: molecular chaperone HtpG [Bacteroidota bacterium]
MERGNISVSTENIFPIIKKSLYSDQEIFLRELVANAVDACQKLRHLSTRGVFEGELGELGISVALDKEARTITVSDNGLGMTEEEVKKYLNQVAFSGAEEFLKNFQDADKAEDIIGKFGLGFYSAFMVAETVEVVTQSYQEAPAVRWTCTGSTEYSIEAATREARGTDIILHVAEDEDEFLEEARIKAILDKYCKFLPIAIKFKDEQINNPNPIWKKPPSELTDEDYQGFFKELYPFAEEPLFWIHLNVDFPFNLTGILFFPKIRQDIDPRRNQIQLYSRQVFITDEVQEIVPEYLMLLQGVIDSPDIPLNVSRSYLQSDSNVRKISNYITRKVADKLNEIFRDDRESFEEKWRDISVFVKYGMMTDDKFYEKAEKFCLLENVAGNLFTLEDYKDKIKEAQTDKDEKLVHLYTSDKEQQDIYVRAAEAGNYDVLHMNGVLDPHFIGLLERKQTDTRWARVDSDTLDKLIPKAEGEEADTAAEGEDLLNENQLNKIKETFEKAADHPGLTVVMADLGAAQLPITITRPEFMRRMKDMSAVGGGSPFGGADMPDMLNLVVNQAHPVVKRMAKARTADRMARQLVDLALLSQNLLQGKALTDFIERSVDILRK